MIVWIKAIERVHAAFEFMDKMQIPFFCFSNVDIAPRGKDIAETNERLDRIVEVIKEEMDRQELSVYGDY